MLRIGEFSRLSQVTIKALRYYDDMGLLKPAHIDKFTGYRYYTVEQLPHIHRIIAFKELGLSLEQIASLMNGDPSPEQIRDLLRLQQAEIQQRIHEERARLAQVEFRLRMIETENRMPSLDVIVKPVPPLRALTLRVSLSHDNLTANLLALQSEIEQVMKQRHIKFASPLTEIHYGEEFRVDYQDVELVLPVDESQTEDVPLATAGVLRLKTVPGLPMAATYIHQGDYMRQYPDILPLLQHWIVDNDYKLCGTHRIIHHRGAFERAEYEDWIMEYQHEIELSDDLKQEPGV